MLLFIGILTMAMSKDNPPPLLKLYNDSHKESPAPKTPPLINQQIPSPPAPPQPAGSPPPPPPGYPPETPPPPGQPPTPPPPPQVIPQGGQSITYEGAQRAIETAKRARPYITPGKVWLWRGPGGEVIYKAGLVYQGAVIGVIEFDPSSGLPLPKGYKPYSLTPTLALEEVKKKLPSVVSELQVLPGAEYRAPESCWVIPLVFRGMIVAHIKIYYDGIHVVPDYPANQEMNFYGR